MKIVSIFGNKLYAFKHTGRRQNELRHLLDLWNDSLYVYNFLKANSADIPNNKSIPELTTIIADNANAIDDILNELSRDHTKRLDTFFKPLHNQEYRVRLLSLQKGRERYLRLYAIRIDDNCFVITGGAIKFTHLMQESEHTNAELTKLNQCRDFLDSQGIFDADSFYEWINEQQ